MKPWLVDRRLIGLVVAMFILGGCGWLVGGDDSGTGSDIDTFGDPAAVEEPDNDSGGAGESDDEVALEEIVDPADTEDGDGTTPDTAPDSTISPGETRDLRTGVQDPMRAGEWEIAADRAAMALGRSDLDPDFRQELEAYRDLAEAAERDDDVAAEQAIDRLQEFEPEFVDDLTVLRVLPEGIQSAVDFTAEGIDEQAAAGVPQVDTDDGADTAPQFDTDDGADTAARVDDVARALTDSDWKLADRLAADLLKGGKLSAEDTARVRIYQDLADAYLAADTLAVADATRSLADVDSDLAVRLDPDAGQ